MRANLESLHIDGDDGAVYEEKEREESERSSVREESDPNSREEREDQEPVRDQNDNREGAEVLEKDGKGLYQLEIV